MENMPNDKAPAAALRGETTSTKSDSAEVISEETDSAESVEEQHDPMEAVSTKADLVEAASARADSEKSVGQTAGFSEVAEKKQREPFARAATEDDDGYDPWSDRIVEEPFWEKDPWS